MSRRETIIMVLLTLLVFSTALVSQESEIGQTNVLTQQINEYKTLMSQLSEVNSSNEVIKQENEALTQVISDFEVEIENTEKQLKTAKERELSLVVAEAQKAKATSQIKSIQTTREATTDWIKFTASFYNAGAASTGKQPGDKQYGITRSGRPVTPGVTVSVDPRIIPLGTMIEIMFPDGHIECRRADDTGSAIRGHKIDIFSPLSNSKLLELGVQNVQVRILS